MKKNKLFISLPFVLALFLSCTFFVNADAESNKNVNNNVVTTNDKKEVVQELNGSTLYTYKNLQYSIDNGEIIINRCSDLKAVNVDIPSEINHYKVKGIDKLAFYNLSYLQSVSIPETVSEIGKGAFAFCTNLKSVNISNGVKKISTGAFTGCESLEKICIPSSVVEIGKGAFGQCTKLNTIVIYNPNVDIYEAAFSNYDEKFYKSMVNEMTIDDLEKNKDNISQYDKYKKDNNNREIYGAENSKVKSFAEKEGFNFYKHNVYTVISTHVQNIGWQSEKNDYEMSGTQGRSLRLEGITMKVNGDSDLGIRYNTQIQSIGWQGWKNNGQLSGTVGKSLRLEAIRIQLTGKNKDKYDIYYKVHAQHYGWLDWAKNGEISGTAGMSLRLEGIEVVIVNKGDKAPGSTVNSYYVSTPDIRYKTHVQHYGWQNYVSNGITSGTVGKSLRLEGIVMNLSKLYTSGEVQYKTHIQNMGWQEWKNSGELSGTTGKSLRLEAICINLTGEAAGKFDIYYRVHAQHYGWLDWAKNGKEAGTSGQSFRLEGIEVKVVPKGSKAPGSTARAYVPA